MKLFKKLLAAVAVTALALTMLTACGGGNSTFAVVDYMNDLMKMYGNEVTYKADSSLDANAKNVAEFIKKSGKSMDALRVVIEGASAGHADEEGQAVYAACAKAAGVTNETKDKYRYEVSYAVSDPKLTTDAAKDSFGMAQAQSLATSYALNTPEAIKVYREDYDGEKYWNGQDIDETKLDKTTNIGTATVEVNGTTYLVAVLRTAVKAK